VLPLPTLEAYASQMAGTPISISCDAPSSFAPGVGGFVNFVDGAPQPVIHLPAPTCDRIEHAGRSNSIIPSDFLTITHEVEHIATRSQNECDVERLALANTWQFVRLLKLAAWRAQAIVAGLRYVDAHLQPQYHAGCSS
jgi:hypothetical protein